MEITLRCSISAMFSLDSLTSKTHPRIKQCVAKYHTTKVIAHKASYSKLCLKIGCHGNVLQHCWTPYNTRFLLGPIQHHNPNGISISLAVFAQMTAECPYTLQWVPLSPSKLPLPMGGSGPPYNTWFLGPPETVTQTASRSVQPFLKSSLV